ncbi:MAG: Fe-S cluster assembly protein SufD [Actinomycetaceae bacterium]|nr:Fe-S cluster assembly protein SufD [Actinomycetaceae bacterium]
MSEISIPTRNKIDSEPGNSAGTKTINSRADRPTSYKLDDIPVPNGREEDWRFTPLSRIESLFADTLSGQPAALTFDGKELTEGPLNYRGEELPVHVTFVDKDDDRVGFTEAPGDRTAVVEWNNINKACVLTVTKNAEVEVPIVVRMHSTDNTPAAQHLSVICEEGATATVVLLHSGTAQLNQGIEVKVGDSANLTLCATHEWDLDAVHASNHRMTVGKDAVLKHIVVTFGGDLVRVCSDLAFEGTGGDIEMLGLYYTDSKQHHEHRLYVDHCEPKCTSRVTYKGALQGEGAHSVWIGDVLIGQNGFDTDSYEENRNLVLTEGAHADSVPNLEIENGEIEGAGHASATGRFDDEQLFYLRSRGIDEDTARRLVVRGFFAELIDQIGVETVQEHLMTIVEKELDTMKETA